MSGGADSGARSAPSSALARAERAAIAAPDHSELRRARDLGRFFDWLEGRDARESSARRA